MQNYLRPASVQDVLCHLAERSYCIIAGGSDFYPARVGRTIDEPVLDISGLQALRGIVDDGAYYRIGAMTTWRDIQEAQLPDYFNGLKQAAHELGGLQVQNVGTLCGNIANASPAADSMPNLLTLDAEVELRSLNNSRCLPVAEFVSGNRKTKIKPNELISAVLIPKQSANTRSYFTKLGARRYLVISIAMVAVLLASEDGASISQARIAIGACSEVAQRLPALEQALIGQALGSDLSAHITLSDLQGLRPIDDIRARAEYRREAALIMLRRAVRTLAGEFA